MEWRFSRGFFEEVGFAKAVLDETVSSEQLFAVIYEIDEDDDPFDEECWIKACPNMGVSITPGETTLIRTFLCA